MDREQIPVVAEVLNREKPVVTVMDDVEIKQEQGTEKEDGVKIKQEPVSIDMNNIEMTLKPVSEAMDAVEIKKEPVSIDMNNIKMTLKPVSETMDAVEIKKEPVSIEIKNVEIKQEPISTEMENVEIKQESVSMEMENVKIKQEPVSIDMNNIKMKLKPVSEAINAVEIKQEPVSMEMENVEIKQEPVSIEIENVKIKQESVSMEIESVEIKQEPVSIEVENVKIKQEMDDVDEVIILDAAKNGKSGNTKEESDLYSYTRLNDFTSEIYKIELGNLPNYIGYGQLRKLLNVTLKLNPRKVKAIGNPPHFAFITFRNEEDREKALKALENYVWKGKTLSAKKASPAADPMAKKRKAGDSEDCSSSKRAKEDDDISVELRLKNAVTPLWNVPYEAQLKMKEDDIHKFLMKLCKGVEKANAGLKPLISKSRKENHYQICPLTPIKPSPVTSGYRNKCEFTAGRHLHTKEKTVGFRLNSYKQGSMSVAEPDDCINISPAMLKAVKSFEAYIRESDKDVYNPENHAGYWRQLTVRTSNNSDVLLIIVMHPQLLSASDVLEEEYKLKKYYQEGPGSTCDITSVYFQLFSKKTFHEEPSLLTHLVGKKCLEETLLGMKFQVSPEAFFQINVPASEVLYTLVTDIVKTSSSATALDVCCGTGTISLCLAKAGIKVIGIEMCPQAVENARLNASANDLSDVKFLCGKAEDTIHTALKQCDESSEIIAVVDPPRAGLHQKVVKALRANDKIKKIIYISCHPTAAYNNFVDLCRAPSNNYRGVPFYPIQAAVVDMFPHTPHKELVLIFQRFNEIDM